MLANLRFLTCAALILSSLLYTVLGQKAAPTEFLLAKPLVSVWRRDYPRILSLPPANFGSTIYTAIEGGEVTALDIARGVQIWRTEVGGDISAAPVADDKGVYVATRKSPDSQQAKIAEQGTLRCLTHGAGLTRWASDLADALKGNIVVADSSLYSLDASGALVAYSKADGARQWRLRLDSVFVTDVVANNGLIFVGTQDNSIYGVEQATGAIKWHSKMQGNARISALAIAERLVFVGTADGRVHALNVSNGNDVWTKKFGGTIKSVLPVANNLIITTLNNFIYNVEIARGRRIWKKQTAGRIAASPLADGDSVLIASASGEACVVFRISTGKVVNTIPVSVDGITITNTVLTKDALIFTTNEGVIGYAASSELAR